MIGTCLCHQRTFTVNELGFVGLPRSSAPPSSVEPARHAQQYLFIVLTSVSPLCGSNKRPSGNLSHSQCGTTAHVVSWAALHPAPNPRAQRRVGISEGGIQNKKYWRSRHLDMFQPMVNTRQVSALCTRVEVAATHVSTRTSSCMCVQCYWLDCDPS